MEHFLHTETSNIDFKCSKFHVIPIPMEKTVSYGGGTRFGPRAILEASGQLESFDGQSSPFELGIHTTEAVDCSNLTERVAYDIEQTVGKTIAQGAIPVSIGGEHTITHSIIKGIKETTDEPFFILQIDAHADLRNSYEGYSMSHATVLRRVHEDFKTPILQAGVRALSKEEHDYRANADDIYSLDVEELEANLKCHTCSAQPTFDDFINKLPDNVYITIDIDGFDPSVFPTTGTPVPGGLSWYTVMTLLDLVIRHKKVIGVDLNEYAPIKGFQGYDMAAAQVIYNVMGMIQRSSK